ncbi:AAA family ATPase [Shewanella sp. MEBiC00475]|uniref:AAA family ATPase n=1 Tax=Shewanella sp. MEBiC00475 TaxID=2575361 RepID=UPI001586705B|nr:AAA family ATPase [Shewanella sp. MEBiC00475]
MRRLKAESIFTPKGNSVNEKMYVPRSELETAFIKALRKPKHIIVHGESGCGKTWLYKKILAERKIKYEVLNAATVNTAGSISNAIRALTARLTPFETKSYEERKGATASVGVAKGDLQHTRKYDALPLEPYLELIRILYRNAGANDSFLVIENLEHIVKDEKLVRELSSILMYLDDSEYAKYKIRIILVGTTSNLRDYFSKIDSSQTIINRTQEIPEVSVLLSADAKALVKRGFFDLLKAKCLVDPAKGFDEGYLLNAISWFSANVPQYIHELCLELALEIEANNYIITNELYTQCLRNWVQEALVSENTRMEAHLNSKATKHARRNQVIFTIGLISSNEFSAQEVEDSLRNRFPDSTYGKTLNIPAILNELASGNSPLIRKTPKGTRFRFLDPKIKIMARWILVKDEGKDTITVKKFDESIKF